MNREGDHLKKRSKLLILIFMALLLVIGYKKYFFTFERLGQGSYYKGPVDSPNGKNTANSYFKNYGGATGGANIWIEITNNENNQTKMIYYSDGKSNFDMEWKNDYIINIRNDEGSDYPDSNRSIELEVGKEIYDERGLACDSWIMKNEYETCYQN